MVDYTGPRNCCICGKEFNGYGNNPWPISENIEEDRCCKSCVDVVITARLHQMGVPVAN